MRRLRRLVLPSRTLVRYKMRLFALRFAGLLLGLTSVLQMLDLLAASPDILAAPGADYSTVLHYVSLRWPQLVGQFTPFVALLAVLLSLATLVQTSEVTVMRASGLSVSAVLLPFGLACGCVSVAHFAFQETVVIPATRALEAWRDVDYAVDFQGRLPDEQEIRLANGNQLVHIDSLNISAGRVILDGVTLYDRGSDARITLAQRADFALYTNGRWQLYNVRRLDAVRYEGSSAQRQDWALDISPERLATLTLKPEEASLGRLRRAIRQGHREGRPTDRLEASFYKRFSDPAASLVMPLVGVIVAFATRRAGGLTLRVTLGVALGFAYFVGANIMLALGKFGVAPPLLAAWTPFLLYLLAGYGLLLYLDDGARRGKDTGTAA